MQNDKARNLTWALQVLLLRTVDIGIASLVFVAPLIMGGRHPVGRLVFVAIVSVIAIAWLARQCLLEKSGWTFSGAEFLILAVTAVLSLQLVPLSTGYIQYLAPLTVEYLPLWTIETDGAFSFRGEVPRHEKDHDEQKDGCRQSRAEGFVKLVDFLERVDPDDHRGHIAQKHGRKQQPGPQPH